MKIGRYNIFPEKIKVSVRTKSGDKFHFYCDNLEFDFEKGFTFDGAPNIHGVKFPGKSFTINPNSIESVGTTFVRLFRIYKFK